MLSYKLSRKEEVLFGAIIAKFHKQCFQKRVLTAAHGSGALKIHAMVLPVRQCPELLANPIIAVDVRESLCCRTE